MASAGAKGGIAGMLHSATPWRDRMIRSFCLTEVCIPQSTPTILFLQFLSASYLAQQDSDQEDQVHYNEQASSQLPSQDHRNKHLIGASTASQDHKTRVEKCGV
jgi:hypothetical protein